ncbi:hypothetical protein Q9L58_009907 [Maublancomyces gigas]|uniref:Uncharacterized protein n=1 Tax=Discina gigas TaxID=1032678 RepID=A0ABR3G6M2_9PEZI
MPDEISIVQGRFLTAWNSYKASPAEHVNRLDELEKTASATSLTLASAGRMTLSPGLLLTQDQTPRKVALKKGPLTALYDMRVVLEISENGQSHHESIEEKFDMALTNSELNELVSSAMTVSDAVPGANNRLRGEEDPVDNDRGRYLGHWTLNWHGPIQPYGCDARLGTRAQLSQSKDPSLEHELHLGRQDEDPGDYGYDVIAIVNKFTLDQRR